MSLMTGQFNPVAKGLDAYGLSANVDMMHDALSDTLAQAGPSILDTLTAHRFDNHQNLTAGQNGPNKTADEQAKATSTLQGAFMRARGLQADTTKLQAGKMTVASGPGARSTAQTIDKKAKAGDDLNKAVAGVKKDMAQNAPANDGPKGGTVGKLATDVAVGVVADAVWPGSGAYVTAAIGAGSFGGKNEGGFSSRAAKGAQSVYGTAEGQSTVDVMSPNKPAMAGQDFNTMMAKGFGNIQMPADENSLDTLGQMGLTFSGEKLALLEGMAKDMGQDAQLGKTMYNKWADSDMNVTDKIGDTKIAELKVNSGDEAALTSDKPQLQEDFKVQGMKLA